MSNYRLKIQYDGTRYRGWQRQKNSDNTIQGKIEQVLYRLLDTTVEIDGAGRTDAGVHAIGQVANFHLDEHFSAEEISIYDRLHQCTLILYGRDSNFSCIQDFWLSVCIYSK